MLNPAVDKKNDGFILYELDTNADIEICDFHGSGQQGAEITILVKKLHDLVKASSSCGVERCYFRFRIQSAGLQETFVFGRNYKWADAIFHDTLTATKFMDFRINQSRSLPKTLCEEIDSAGGYLPIKALHFLLLTKDTTTVSSDVKSSMRRLEQSIWDCYIPAEDDETPSESEDIIAYHWKRKSNQEAKMGGHIDYAQDFCFTQWDVFIILKFIHKRIKNLAIYLIFAIALGIGVNGISMLLGF